MTIGAIELARMLGRTHEPTPEQVRVIEADLEPMLVVAGAGSGKTATMTDRVLWLVANGLVEPSEILGLTFTRKAASELASRVERELRILARTQATAADALTAAIERPRIATYNSYASGLVTDHGLRLGLEADQTLLTEAGRFQVAMSVVERWSGDLALDYQPVTVARAVVTLAGELAEHLLTPQEAAERLLAIADELGDAAPEGRQKAPYAPVAKVIDSLRSRAALMPLVAAFSEAKRERGAMDFPDQVEAAARLGQRFEVVGESERATARVVLLDEYQDTSVAQLAMLRALFGSGHPVTAVGDPHQGIYGWRGASAGALMSFPEHFPRHDGIQAAVATLSTSWRNDRAILLAANRVAGPLRSAASLEVPPLSARPGAGRGRVHWAYAADRASEAAAMADSLASRWRPGRGTAAVLCRKRDLFEPVRAALEERGLPCQVVGLAGLLHTPAVADVRAAMTAAFDPSRGDALMRLLTGPAFRLGASDLMALAALARERTRGQAGPEQRKEDVDAMSIVEALDLPVAAAAWTSRDGRELSPAGRERVAAAQQLLRSVRSMTHLGLPDLVLAVEQALGLDLELEVHRPGRGRADLDAFVVAAAEFEAGAPAPTLGAFLSYLEAAEEYERGLDVAAAEPDPDCVQVLTIHAAKGLEWDVVGVVGLTEKDFPGLAGPAHEPTSPGWTSGVESLPYELRGDASHLPELAVPDGATHRDVRDALEEFKKDDGARELREERRLAYVALTRARSELVLTGSWWSHRNQPSQASRFLTEVVADGLAEPLDPDGSDPAGSGADSLREPPERPESAEAPSGVWPPPQEAALESALTAARDRVAGKAAPAAPLAPTDPIVAEWWWQARALLAERDGEAGAPREPVTALSASAAVALASDPAAFALERRRPVPARPSSAARRGTRFHAWLERHFAKAALIDVDDLDHDEVGSDEELLALQRAFLGSSWASREPIAIEVDVETPVAGVQVRCRIDAVFPPADGEGCAVHIVDWKTGSPARGEDAQRARELQLALYRLGWSRLHGVPIEKVAASFHFVGDDATITAPLLTEAEVEHLLASDLAALDGLRDRSPGR